MLFKENNEEVVITLTAKNPQAPQNKIRYNITKNKFEKVRLVETMIDHLEIESRIIHKDSEEAKQQLLASSSSLVKGK